MACIKQMLKSSIPVKFRDAMQYYGEDELYKMQYDHVKYGFGIYCVLLDNKRKNYCLNVRSGKFVSVNSGIYK